MQAQVLVGSVRVCGAGIGSSLGHTIVYMCTCLQLVYKAAGYMQSVTPPYQCLLSGLCQRSRVTCLRVYGGHGLQGSLYFSVRQVCFGILLSLSMIENRMGFTIFPLVCDYYVWPSQVSMLKWYCLLPSSVSFAVDPVHLWTI